MKTLFISDNEEFILDLTGIELNWTEENSWFSDDGGFILSSTFPFKVPIDWVEYFIQFKYYNTTKPVTKFNGRLQKCDGKIVPAYLEIEGVEDQLTGTIRAGIELFPIWDKMLNELDLGVVNPPEGMLAHAESVISQTWPAVNYNFPQVWCYDLYKDNPLFSEYFHGYYNRRVLPTGFIQNISVPEENIFANHNIVYPFPYWIHIIKSGVEMAGYTLHGDILTDPHFTKACMPIKKIEFKERPENINWIISGFDYVEESGPYKYYSEEFTLNPNTRYRIKGKVKTPDGFIFKFLWFRIRFNGSVVYYYELQSNMPDFVTFDFHIPPGSGGILKIDANYWILGSYTGDLVEVSIIPTHIYNDDGTEIPAIANFNNVNLAEQLPDITFGDLIKILRAWKNYDFDLRDGKQIWMNRIEGELKHEGAIDLRKFDVPKPKRKFEQLGSYVLKFAEENEDYPLTQTYVSLDGIFTSNFKTDETTKEIVINAIPLPVVPGNYLSDYPTPTITAKMITEDTSKVTLVLYDGLDHHGNNWTKPVDELHTPACVERDWFKFMMFMLRSVVYFWKINGGIAEFFNLTKKSKIIAYNNFMIVKTLNRKQKGKYEEIDIEARTF